MKTLSLVASVFLVLASSAQAQTPAGRASAPRIGYVYPAGGQQGTTFNVVVGGQFLDGVAAASFWGDGITARVISHQRPTNQKEDNELKEELEKLIAKRKTGATLSEEERESIPRIREKLEYRMNRQTAPSICEAVTIEVSIAPDASVGERELRLKNANGASNPLTFIVGSLPEFSEKPAHPNTVAPGGRDATSPKPLKNGPERTVTVPAVLNGQILPGEMDRIRFHATKGQNIVVAAEARALIPYLADAVPGWFQATLALYDVKGRELAYDDDFRFSPDPVVFHRVRADGDYVLAIKDAIYRGRQDFVYRITVGDVPFITSVFPLGGRLDSHLQLALNGWNLPERTNAIDLTGKSEGTFEFRLAHNRTSSNTIQLAVSDDAHAPEREPNDDTEQAQHVTLPAVIDGRIGSAKDRDTFVFEGKRGQVVVAEVVARRLNSPLDSLLQLTNSRSERLAANDDSEDKGAGLTTHHADSRILYTLLEDGTYRIHLADAQAQGGEEFSYELHLRPARPDFDLRITPSAINLRSGWHLPITVFVLRKDGYTGPVDLSLQDPSGAFSLAGARIPAGQDKIRLTLTTTAAPRESSYPLTLVGSAEIGGAVLTRTAAPAEDMMQAFAYRHLVPAKALSVHVVGRGKPPKSAFRVTHASPVKLHPGGTATIRAMIRLGKTFENLQLELSEPPEGVSIGSTSQKNGTFEVVLAADPGKVKRGQQGNLILLVTGERASAQSGKPADEAKTPKNRRVPVGVLPAVPYEIVAP